MTEQLNMFGERDPAQIVAEWLVEWHDHLVKCGHITKKHIGYELADYVLGEFSHYSGGTAHGSLADAGYKWYDFSPKGCHLNQRCYMGGEVFIKKSAILRVLGIRDDGRDIMKEEIS